MFDPHQHRSIFIHTRRKPYAIVRVTPYPEVVSCTAASNPRKRFMRVVSSRGLREAYAIVRLRDMAVVAEYPPMVQKGGPDAPLQS